MADEEIKEEEQNLAEIAKQAETDRRRAEIRKRMEEASKAKKAKKGFMTPDRKKKLRLLLRKKAAEELKKEQERKASDRIRIIQERCGELKNIDDVNEDELSEIVTELWNRMYTLEGEKFDLEREFRMRAFEISELNSQVNDLRGKFVKPTLKKVSKYENKFSKLQKKAAEFNFRNQLKVVKKKEFTLEEEDKEKKPEWSKKGEEKKDDDEGEEENDSESVMTEGDALAESAGTITDGEKSEGAISEAALSERATPDLDIPGETPPVVEEVQPPSPAPEELWSYLKDVVTSDIVVSVDELVEKLVTTVNTIPQPYLRSVVKENIKKQKSIEEEEQAAHEQDAVNTETTNTDNAEKLENDPNVTSTETSEKVEENQDPQPVVAEGNDATLPESVSTENNPPENTAITTPDANLETPNDSVPPAVEAAA